MAASLLPKEAFCLSADYEPQTICEHLQYLFALLQNSTRRYIDPSGFVKALGLDTGQQQVTFGHVHMSSWPPLGKRFHSQLWEELGIAVPSLFLELGLPRGNMWLGDESPPPALVHG